MPVYEPLFKRIYVSLRISTLPGALVAAMLFTSLVSFGQWNANGNYAIAGKVGIGTSSPWYKLDIINREGESQNLVRVRVHDAPSDFLLIQNQTSATNQFIPGIHGFHDSDNREALYIVGATGLSNDVGANPIMVFDARLSTSEVSNRTLFAWDSYGARKMVLSAAGNLGVGVTAPLAKLHVKGSLMIDGGNGGTVGTGNGSRIALSSGGITSIEENWGINLIGNDESPVKIRNAALLIGYESSSAGWGTNGDLLVQGNVGIGTTNPDARLTINGDVHAREVRVDLSGSIAPDYVFEELYELMPLDELEAHIRNKRHLPGIPSGMDMAAHGLNLKQMNLALLKKVEELTLYLLILNKQVRRMKEENDLQATRIQHLLESMNPH